MTIIFWLLGPILSLVSVFLSIYLNRLSFFDPKSYSGGLGTFYFIAISLASLSCTEAFELALILDPKYRKSWLMTGIAIILFLNLVFLFCSVGLYTNYVGEITKGTPSVTQLDLLLPVMMIVIVLSLALIVKFTLEKFRP